MSDKILMFLAGAFYHFGIAKFLKEKIDCEIYSIVDVDDKPKKFFSKQDIVNFSKIWYYRDNVKVGTKNDPDLVYLSDFEKKYQIDLWKIAYADPKFYKFNRFYKFSCKEILFLLEQNCRFFEKILDEVKPDFLLMGVYDSHHTHLLYKICRAKNIKTLILGSTRFGFTGKISLHELEFDFIDKLNDEGKKQISREELLDYLKEFDHSKHFQKYKSKLLSNRQAKKYSTFFKFLITGGSSTYHNHFSRYGFTRTKLIKLVFDSLKKNSHSFLLKNSVKNLEKVSPFVYYPLHSEPERAISIAAPYYTNQIEVITNIAKSLPVEYFLLVKEHPSMILKGGSKRKISFYKEIMKLPNVKLLNPQINRDEILKKCSLVITINGTAGLEAAFFNKPAITFIKTDYHYLSSVHTLKKLDELPKAITTFLKKQVNPIELYNYIKMVEKNSFKYIKSELNLDFYSRFYDRGYLTLEKEILVEKMKNYLKENEKTYDDLTNQFIKKMKQFKDYNSYKKNKNE